MEGVLAAFAQFDNDVRSDRTRAGMKAALELGRWGLTGSWSKGRSEYYAYSHCRPGCRAVNVTKATLEGLFADELALLRPSPGYMRLLKESVLQIWKARKVAVRDELANASSSVRSTSRPTTATRRDYARSSRSPGSTATQVSSKNST